MTTSAAFKKALISSRDASACEPSQETTGPRLEVQVPIGNSVWISHGSERFVLHAWCHQVFFSIGSSPTMSLNTSWSLWCSASTPISCPMHNLQLLYLAEHCIHIVNMHPLASVVLLLFSLCLSPFASCSLSSFTDWCLVHRQQSREQKKKLGLSFFCFNKSSSLLCLWGLIWFFVVFVLPLLPCKRA